MTTIQDPKEDPKPVLAIVISGGQPIDSSRSVEVLRGNGTPWCYLPQLPDNRSSHTMAGLVTCGGGFTRYSCLSFASGHWIQSHDLIQARWSHIQWSSHAGLILMGGYTSATTSEILTNDGKSKENFTLKYKTKYFVLNLQQQFQFSIFYLVMHAVSNWMTKSL